MYQVTTYNEALENVDVQEWKRVMDREMESVGSNLVWSLIEALRGGKTHWKQVDLQEKEPW